MSSPALEPDVVQRRGLIVVPDAPRTHEGGEVGGGGESKHCPT
jgi:hypothetical protein